VFLSTLSSILFLGGYLVPGVESNGLITGLSLGLKTSFILFLFIRIRASQKAPRLRRGAQGFFKKSLGCPAGGAARAPGRPGSF